MTSSRVTPHSLSIDRIATSPVVPLFRDGAFDAQTTQSLGFAYYIACGALHPKGQPSVIQETLAQRIIEAAARGERDPERLATIALANLGAFHRDVTRRFGLVPNFFMSAPEAPEILEKLWDFATSAYLDNPIPSLQGALVRFSIAVLPSSILHRSTLRISSGLRPFLG